ncbi:MAG: hypothetical protein ABIL06_13135 [Pseudomonadota bacterium]
MTIDMQDITDGYNQRLDTRLSIKQFLKLAYDTKGSLEKTAVFIGLSEKTLAKYMRINGVKIRTVRGGHPGKYHKYLAAKLADIPDDRLLEMTPHHVMAEIDCNSRCHIYNLLNQQGRAYKRQTGWRRNGGET